MVPARLVYFCGDPYNNICMARFVHSNKFLHPPSFIASAKKLFSQAQMSKTDLTATSLLWLCNDTSNRPFKHIIRTNTHTLSHSHTHLPLLSLSLFGVPLVLPPNNSKLLSAATTATSISSYNCLLLLRERERGVRKVNELQASPILSSLSSRSSQASPLLLPSLPMFTRIFLARFDNQKTTTTTTTTTTA